LGFVIYATFLLYYMSPAGEARPGVGEPHRAALEAADGDAPDSAMLSPEEVCEHESIDFEQKKSTDEVMIRLKRELYNEVLAF
jgi:hypothetical protein